MSETAVQPAAAEVDGWLERFEDALTREDPAAAAELFLDDSYWRDLIAFTWNISDGRGPRRRPGHARADARRRPAPQLAAPPSRPPRPTA